MLKVFGFGRDFFGMTSTQTILYLHKKNPLLLAKTLVSNMNLLKGPKIAQLST